MGSGRGTETDGSGPRDIPSPPPGLTCVTMSANYTGRLWSELARYQTAHYLHLLREKDQRQRLRLGI